MNHGWETFSYVRHVSWRWKHCREPHAIIDTQHVKWYLPKSTAFSQTFLLFDVSNILNPSQTLQGALLPTVTSARTWDYEVQSKNLANPQLEELHWQNNKEIIKDHFNKRVTQVIKVELVHVFVWICSARVWQESSQYWAQTVGSSRLCSINTHFFSGGLKTVTDKCRISF